MLRTTTPTALVPIVLLCACGAPADAPAQAPARPSAAAPSLHAPVERLPLPNADPVVREAQAALAAGRPWEATRLLEPVLRDPARRAPPVVLVAAQAAARWGGWTQVEQLLGAEPWADTLFGGEGRELLARAALARRTPAGDSTAAAHARRSLGSAAGGTERGVRLVLLARALDRSASRALPPAARAAADSAARAYADAATLLPDAADWLRLRAAGVEGDAAARARLYAGVQRPAARARVPWTEAQALERAGDLPAAQRAYETVGARATALGIRLRAAPADRALVRQELVELVTRGRGTAAARDAVDLLDRTFAPLTAAEQLVAARSTGASGPLARAATGYAAAFAGGVGTEQDRFAYASLLFRLGRNADAAEQFALVRGAPLAGAADYQRARALLRAGRGGDATALLRQIVATRAADSAAAGSALYLLGDLASDDNRDGDARRLLREVVERYPAHTLAPTAAFRAAVVALTSGDATAAAGELDALAGAYPRSTELLAATYWSGRAWAAAGDGAQARTRWQRAIEHEPVSYYAMLAARRLGVRPWAPPDTARLAPPDADVAAAMRRAALLEGLDMDVEARFERDRLLADAGSSVPRLLATARAFRDAALASPAIRLAEQALARGAPRSAELYRLLYPLVFDGVVQAEARARGVDPALLAALIKQESNFTPAATSPAGARGLMQMMPAVGRTVATSLRFPSWDPVLLYQPDVNVRLGAAHLAGVLRQYPAPAYALADYNAGRSRVVRWRQKPGADDPELFTERIPYVETRDYVRIVLRNRELYAALYPSLAWTR